MKMKKTIMTILALAFAFVTVFALAACGEKVPTIESIALDKTEVSIATGEIDKLAVTATYDDKTTAAIEAKDVEWKVSDEAIATVMRGVVSAKKAGTVTVTAEYAGKAATCSVTVYALEVEISDTAVTVEKNTKKQLTAAVKKDGTALSGEEIVWSSDNEKVATVDDKGLVTAWVEGNATITAKRKNGSQSATCAVTVNWEKPEGVVEMTNNTEQNKSVQNEWSRWCDEGCWEFGNTTVNELYTANYTVDTTGYVKQDPNNEIIVLNRKVVIDFEVKDHSGRSGESNPYAQVQVTFRSAKNGSDASVDDALLLTNHIYKVSFNLNSSVAGEIKVNPLSPDCEDPIEIVAGDNKIEVTFRHGDWGVIYPEGNYTNLETALFLQLGKLDSARAIVNIKDIIWEDLGEAEEKTECPDFTPEVIDIPDLSQTEAIALAPTTADEDHYTVTATDEGKTQQIVYTNVEGGTYANLACSLTGTAAATSNVFSVKIKNNGDRNVTLRFDIDCPTGITKGSGGENTNSKDCAIKAVATVGTPAVDNTWDGTTIEIAAGAETTLYIFYDATTDRGAPENVLIYCETFFWENNPDNPASEGRGSYSGDITLSEFKFATVA